jgi:hypothetical protein
VEPHPQPPTATTSPPLLVPDGIPDGDVKGGRYISQFPTLAVLDAATGAKPAHPRCVGAAAVPARVKPGIADSPTTSSGSGSGPGSGHRQVADRLGRQAIAHEAARND